MAEQDELARTRAIVTEALRQLRTPIRRERRRQRFRRFTGQSFFQLEQVSGKPAEVPLAGTGFTPLWETAESGPDDLDLRHPHTVTRRFTLGQLWYVWHDYDETRVVIRLMVDRTGRAWLIAPNAEHRFPASAEGWEKLVRELGQYSRPRGGRWEGAG